jgi:hypothetical protein
MTYDLMHGAQFAKQYVNDYLKTDIPTRLVDYRNGWGLDSTVLPAPELFLVHEPIAIDHWPTVITVAISTNRFERLGMVSHGTSARNPEYRVVYTMRTYIWSRTEGSESTTIMRDRLTTVIRSALLDRPCLKATDTRDTWQAEIDEGSMREEFSDLTLLKGDRVMAGAYIGYEMSINEVVARADIGVVGSEGIQLGVKNVRVNDPSLDLPTATDYTTTGGSSE